ncbi:YIP1 family protein [Gillisia sp. M10.2A]|uniref:YIP1 family protein n=1 Tax=Gillisia lutea TaxID=2909668 RepID=A0ABS9EGC2_9FLAO|nr:Yip1 family protein [Gillisia lutea]MCF4101912.1 YIP1 family protein [Gillisia lutea]
MSQKLEESNNKIAINSVFETIWLKPTASLKFIIRNYPRKYVTVLLMLGGVVNSVDRASRIGMGDDMSLAAVLIISLGLGAGLGWISFYIYAYTLSITGNWLKGSSEPKEFRTIIAWSLVPSIAGLLLLIPEILFFGDEVFKSNVSNTSLSFNPAKLIFGAVELIFWLWSVVILVKGIKIIQKFSTGRALANMMLPVGIIMGVILFFLLLAQAVGA